MRSWSIAKHLARLGWDVTVVTPAAGDAIDRVAMVAAEKGCTQEGIKRFFAGTLHWRPCSRPTEQLAEWFRYLPFFLLTRLLRPIGIGLDETWVIQCIRKCSQFIPGDFDVVLATGSPFTTFIGAKIVARRLGISYVLDYRDPWVLSALKRNQFVSLIGPLERYLIRHAAETIMVSFSQARNQCEAFGMTKPPVVITNGYDPDVLDGVVAKISEEFAVVYAGTFYQGQREIDPVLKAVKIASEMQGRESNPIRLHYYGSDVNHVMERAKAYDAEHVVSCHGQVPRAQALAAIKGSGVAVVITCVSDKADLAARGIITGKIFEPLGMGVPILLVAPEGSDATAIVEETAVGRSFRSSQVDSMAHWLVELARKQVTVRNDSLKAFSWPVLTGQLDAILCKAITEAKIERNLKNFSFLGKK